jgi:hypothetical protein
VLPMLTLSPSVQSGQSWVLAAAAVLDAAALAASSTKTKDAESARICVRTGTRTFVAIADALGRACPKQQGMARPVGERYGAAPACLCSAGMPLSAEVSQQTHCEECSSLRTQYEEALFFVARRTFVSLDGILVETMER